MLQKRCFMVVVIGNPTTLEKLHTFPGGRKGVQNFTGHTDHVLCLAISSDGEYLASGGRDKLINVWSVKENSHVCVFRQHRDAIAVSIVYHFWMGLILTRSFRDWFSAKIRISYTLLHGIGQSNYGM